MQSLNRRHAQVHVKEEKVSKRHTEQQQPTRSGAGRLIDNALLLTGNMDDGEEEATKMNFRLIHGP